MLRLRSVFFPEHRPAYFGACLECVGGCFCTTRVGVDSKRFLGSCSCSVGLVLCSLKTSKVRARANDGRGEVKEMEPERPPCDHGWTATQVGSVLPPLG